MAPRVASLVLLLAATQALGAPDWTDCPTPCRCKWTSGKKSALCRDAGFTAIPVTLDSDMQVLDLSGNAIQTLEKDAFRNAGLLNLQRIFLKNAHLKYVHRDAFRDLTILVEVDLSHNEISVLEPDTFFGNERLKLLSLNGNPLTRLDAGLFPLLPHLKTLELEDCRLERVHMEAFRNLPMLESLNLKGNVLEYLNEESFMNVAHLKSLALDGNPWRCDCKLRAFRDWFLSSNLRSVSLICTEPERLRDVLWEHLASLEFACEPQVEIAPDSQLVQAEAGGNVTFGCHVRGDPEPEVTWFYEMRPLNHTWLLLEAEEGLLEKWVNISIYNVSDADVGVYSCVAKNSLSVEGRNVTLVLPEVVTATTLSKTNPRIVYWGLVCAAAAGLLVILCAATSACCLRNRSTKRRNRNLKSSTSDQEKKLLDVSVATTERGSASSEALGPSLELLEPPVHITVESEPLPVAVFPPPPEFSASALPAGAFGNIFISVSVSRDRYPDLLEPGYHVTTLPRRPRPLPNSYDNMGPRVTADGSSTLSLPDSGGGAVLTTVHQPPTGTMTPVSEFVSL